MYPAATGSASKGSVLTAILFGSGRVCVSIWTDGHRLPSGQPSYPAREAIIMSVKVAMAQVCRRCASTDTIQTDHNLSCETWYCYDCRRGFEVDMETVAPPAPVQRSSSSVRAFGLLE